MPMSFERDRAAAARATGKRFAEAMAGEDDEVMKAYLFNAAASWFHQAEQHEYIRRRPRPKTDNADASVAPSPLV